MLKYDYLIIGSGLFGSTIAERLSGSGKKCLVIDKRNHIGGNCYTENIDGINVHKYGPHVFHTYDKSIWKHINRFANFNNFILRVKVNYKNKIYSFPINLFTINQIFGFMSPAEARKIVNENAQGNNLEEYAINKVGKELYEIFIKGYTQKQWDINPKFLPAEIIKRINIRTTYDDNYFDSKEFQGIPIGGYTKIFSKMLNGADVKLNTDYFDNRKYFNSLAKKIIYTGKIDEFYDYKYGELEYRSLRFEEERINIPDFQGCSFVNYTDDNIPYTRIIEHKHFEFGDQDFTIISKEYPAEYNKDNNPYYPINNKENNDKYNRYKILSEKDDNVYFGGRLAEYKYYNMDQTIKSVFNLFEKIK